MRVAALETSILRLAFCASHGRALHVPAFHGGAAAAAAGARSDRFDRTKLLQGLHRRQAWHAVVKRRAELHGESHIFVSCSAEDRVGLSSLWRARTSQTVRCASSTLRSLLARRRQHSCSQRTKTRMSKRCSRAGGLCNTQSIECQPIFRVTGTILCVGGGGGGCRADLCFAAKLCVSLSSLPAESLLTLLSMSLRSEDRATRCFHQRGARSALSPSHIAVQ